MRIVAVGGNVLLLYGLFKQHTGKAKHSCNRNNLNTSDDLNNSCRNHNKRNNGKAFNNKNTSHNKSYNRNHNKKEKGYCNKGQEKKETRHGNLHRYG